MNQQQDEQLMQIANLLEDLGYNLERKERSVFVDVVVETLDCIGKGMSKDEVYNLVHNKDSYIYVELAYFCYEQGMKKLHNSLQKFHDSRDEKRINKDVVDKVFKGQCKNPSVFDSAYYVANYINDKQKKKQLKKNKTKETMTVN